MAFSFLSLLALTAASASAVSVTGLSRPASGSSALAIRDTSALTPGCEHSPTSRQCWGEYDINTNYYDTLFHTGRIVEYWLTVEEIDCAPDGMLRKCHVVNGTMPGPAIVADWGDDVVVHVTNNIATNGTTIHWHGVRQLHNTQYDGVPGVSQCPIPPGETFTYKFHASQYGTSMYHGHYSLHYSMGLYGPLIINGPATANYDEDLGSIFLSDWDHETAFELWSTTANFNVTFDGAESGLVNGLNTWNCTATNATLQDPRCLNGGKKFELNFEEGKSYRLRIVNIATEAWFQFSIDSHRFTVIAADFVPIVPYETDSVLVNMGQRYDIIIEANQKPDDYWMRSGFVEFCIPNDAPNNITAIVRYDKDSTADPTSNSTVVQINTCVDEPPEHVVPWVPVDLTNMDGGVNRQDVTGEYYLDTYLRWSVNHSSFMWTNWSNPALGDVIYGNLADIPATDNVFTVGNKNSASNETEWVVLVMDDQTPIVGVAHPMHLHGHDFLVLAARFEQWDGTTDGWQLTNPPRRDTATMPPNGHLVIAWQLDNPGLWALHCHIAWHSSQGYAATVLESPGLLAKAGGTADWQADFAPQCESWNKFYAGSPFQQDDSGI